MLFSRLAISSLRRGRTSLLARHAGIVTRKNVGSLSAIAARSFSSNAPPLEMFCRQCEQTKDNLGCTTLGVCGKTSETSALQDGLIQVVKTVSVWAVAAREAGATADELKAVNVWTLNAAYATMTNVNFSESRIAEQIHEGMKMKQALRDLISAKGGTAPTGDVAELDFAPSASIDDLEAFGRSVSILNRQKRMGNEDSFSLNEIATYGTKGLSAYAAHCGEMGEVDETVMAAVHDIWSKLASEDADMDGLLSTVLRVGEVNASVLGNLDGLHASNFGNPEPTPVRKTAVEGKAILVSGHDLVDLNALLEQTEGTGVNVYTHGEMLPAHSYPKLKKYSHLVGNYGTAWQAQKFEFAAFPGPIVMTSNCIIEPRRIYKERIYTMNAVGMDGVKHVGPDRDFSQVIAQAQSMKGFPKTVEPASYVTTGFNHRAVLPLAGKVIEAVQAGELSRIFLIGGCDGSQWERSYFTELAEETPDDSIILTLGCAKNRIIHNEKLLNATLANGLPRVLDMGQCNDSYSAVVVATELAKALNCGINDLPLSLALSHLEQKAAAVLLTLLSMGVKNIRLGPSLPAYVTPNVLDVLVKNYNLMPTGDAKEDIKAMMAGN